MKSKCDKCGEVAADIDVGFSPGVHEMKHNCGGTWRVLTEAEAVLEPPEPPAEPTEFNPHRAPLSACWWMQRFVDHFVAEMTAQIESGKPSARAAIECLLVGELTHACRLTWEQSDALIAVLGGKTPAESAALIREHDESERRRGA